MHERINNHTNRGKAFLLLSLRQEEGGGSRSINEVRSEAPIHLAHEDQAACARAVAVQPLPKAPPENRPEAAAASPDGESDPRAIADAVRAGYSGKRRREGRLLWGGERHTVRFFSASRKAGMVVASPCVDPVIIVMEAWTRHNNGGYRGYLP